MPQCRRSSLKISMQGRKRSSLPQLEARRAEFSVKQRARRTQRATEVELQSTIVAKFPSAARRRVRNRSHINQRGMISLKEDQTCLQ